MTVRSPFTQRHLPLLVLLLPILASSALAQAPPAAPSAPNVPAQPSAPPAQPSAPPAKPKAPGFRIPKVGLDLDIFMPTSGKTRSRFGSNGLGLGIGLGRPDRPSGTGRISFDFGTQYKKSGDHHLFVAPIGVGYRRAFQAADVALDHTFIPYYGLSLDLVAVDLRSPEDNVHSRFRLAEGGSLVLGTTIGKSGFVEGKYLAVSKVSGFDLSGIKLSAG